MSPARAASLRLDTVDLPRRTHESRRYTSGQGVKTADVDIRKRRAREMDAEGAGRREIRAETGLSLRTLRLMLGLARKW
jgi:hypothetical protein